MTPCCSTLFWKTCVGFSLAAFAITGCAPRGGTPPKEAVVEIEEIEMQPAEPTVKEPAADSGAEARKAVDEEKAAADKAIEDAGRSIQEPENPLTRAAIELRRQFSFDPRVSVDSTMSYAGSHDPSMGYFANTKTGVGTHKNEPDLVEFMRACTGPTPTVETNRLPADS